MIMKKTVTSREISAKSILLKYNTILIFIVLIILSSILSDAFLSRQNIYNVLRQQSPHILVSIGLLLVILTGGIDLSVGSTAAIGSIMIAITIMFWDMVSVGGFILGILITMAVGFLIGSLNGVLISHLKMAPFIATLATMTMGRGMAYILTGGKPIRLSNDRLASVALTSFGEHSEPLFGIPLPVILAAIVTVIFFILMKYTAFGRYIIATGSNESAVRLAGINVNKYKFLAYAIAGTLSSLAGMIVTARAAIATPVAGQGFEMDAIAACVIGGASLSGGKGTVLNTLIGTLIIALISNIMNLLSIAAYPQQVIKGAIIIAAVLMRGVSDRGKYE
jgi:ribose transport system permease protein